MPHFLKIMLHNFYIPSGPYKGLNYAECMSVGLLVAVLGSLSLPFLFLLQAYMTAVVVTLLVVIALLSILALSLHASKVRSNRVKKSRSE
jgi:hypothetical protein